jgi:hypothetical protein
MYENEEYVNEYAVPDKSLIIAELGNTEAEEKINRMLGFNNNRQSMFNFETNTEDKIRAMIGETNRQEINVGAKFDNSPLFERSDRLMGSVNIIDPAEKIRRLLE